MENEKKDHIKEVTVIVNTQPKGWQEKEISYQQVIVLAFGSYSDDEKIVYTVEYFKGEDKKEGSLTKGEQLKVKEGMIFNVSKSDQS